MACSIDCRSYSLDGLPARSLVRMFCLVMNVFLAYSFRVEDRPLVAQIERLLTSHDVHLVTGARLGGEQLTPAVQSRIESADALIAVMTKREPVDAAANKWRTHPWVGDELAYGRAKSKRAIALVENGVDVGGLYGDYERISLDRTNPVEALLDLSETIGTWKAELGSAWQVQLEPSQIGRELRTKSELKCRYRFVSRQGWRTDWKDSPDPIVQGNGTIVYVEGARLEHVYVEVEIIRGNTAEWYSEATPQLIRVALHRRGENGDGRAD